MLEKPDLKKEIGYGTEKAVYEAEDNPNKVVKIYHKEGLNEKVLTPNFMKASFYLGKILHILLPENFLDVSEAGVFKNRDEEQEYRLVQNKIEHVYSEKEITQEKLIKLINKIVKIKSAKAFLYGIIDSLYFDKNKDEEVSKIEDKLINFGFVLHDQGYHNFSSKKEGLVFLDNLWPWVYHDKHLSFDIDRERLSFFINRVKDEDKKRRALTYLGRIIKSYQEDVEAFERAEAIAQSTDDEDGKRITL